MGRTIHASLHSEEESSRPFAASTHWLANYNACFELSLHRRINLIVLTDEKLVACAVAYIRFLGDAKTRINMEKTDEQDHCIF